MRLVDTAAENRQSSDDSLDSWKEIAFHLGRTVRTVQRWERDEDLPVHRHQHEKRGTVYAYRSEIDAWRLERASDPVVPAASASASRAGSPVPLPMTATMRVTGQFSSRASRVVVRRSASCSRQ